MKVIRYTIFMLLFLIAGQSFATHLRAADIVATRIGEKRYEITLTVYTDAESVTDGIGDVPADQATVMVAGEELVIDRTRVVDIGNLTFQNEYTFEYEFPAVNTNYLISYTGIFRNNGILNIQPPSDQKALYVETFVRVDAFTQLNSTPRLLVPPIDLANVGQVYTHNPGAFDVDGDSVSFELLTPRKADDALVDDYRFPDHPSFGPSNFTLNEVTGDITWDTPNIPGEYNIAFLIEEWRNGRRIGFIVRDMQIIVEDSDNERPLLDIPNDTCVASNTLLEAPITAWDANDNSIDLSFEGILPTLGATLIQNQINNDSIEAVFSWTPSCTDVRQQPYSAIFKVEDNHPVNLSTTETWLINVIGEAPENLEAQQVGDNVLLTWDTYNCPNAQTMKIWRSACDSGRIERTSCQTGVPLEWGFELIDEISIEDTSYVDDNGGFGLPRGGKFCYLVDAVFPRPGRGESYASNSSCVNFGLDVPVITRVSVDETSANGSITLDWLAPQEFDTIATPPPYVYEIYRSTGLEGLNFSTTPIATININSLVDTLFQDEGINTLDSAFTYRVDMLQNGTVVASSIAATSVRLDSEVSTQRIILNWENNSFWSDIDTAFDSVFETFPEIDTVFVDSIQSIFNEFTVTGLINGETYCYFVEEQYTICHDSIEETFISRSNVRCDTPLDTVPPCPPILSLEPLDCEQFNPFAIQNSLSWRDPSSADCSDDIESYRIYYRQGLEGDFDRIDEVLFSDQFYLHQNLESQVACYRVTALDDFNNESAFSNTVCQDNCDSINLPNIFSPNGDNANDLYIPIPPTRFVESISFKVYNRWGKLVFESDEFSDIRWDGKDSNGNDLADGLYYYEAIVRFDRLNPENSEEVLKGWVQLVR